jgi:hypothetical protein
MWRLFTKLAGAAGAARHSFFIAVCADYHGSVDLSFLVHDHFEMEWWYWLQSWATH